MQEFIVAAHKAQLIIAVVWLFHFPPPSLSIFLSLSLSGRPIKTVLRHVLNALLFGRFFMILITISAPQQMTWAHNKIRDRERESEEERERGGDRGRGRGREGNLIVKEKQIELKTQFQFEINFSTELFLGPCLWHLNKNSIPRPNGGGETGAGGDWRHAMPWWPDKMRMHKLGGLRCDARNQKRKNEKKIKNKIRADPPW